MPLYISPCSKGGTVAIGVCDRCKLKMQLSSLQPDGNSPGLRVCKDCCDVKDPYRYPARKTENISLRYPRPDSSLPDATESDVLGTEQVINIDFPPEISA